MEQKRLSRMNKLFEKAVDNNASTVEKQELIRLYNEFINDGRTSVKQNTNIHAIRRAVV